MLPEDFNMLNPLKLTKAMVGRLWDHWSEWAEANLPILMFTLAQKQDRRPSDSSFDGRLPKWNQMNWRKRAGFNTEDDESDDKAKADRPSGPAVRPPPSKCPRLSKQTNVTDEQSPAANNGDRTEFLCSLSSEMAYAALLDVMLALPAVVSFFLYFFFGKHLSNYLYVL